jgi:hypothetical protein
MPEGFNINPEDKNRIHDVAKAQQMAEAGKAVRETRSSFGADAKTKLRIAEESENDEAVAYDTEQSMLDKSNEEINLGIQKLQEDISQQGFNSNYRTRKYFEAQIRGLQKILKDRKVEKLSEDIKKKIA